MRHLVIVFAEQVLAKIVEQVTPYCMDVIGVVLSIVIFHQERGTLDSIVMTLARFEPSRPGEINFLFTCLPNLLQIGFGDFGPVTKDIFLEQAEKQFPLFVAEFRRRDSQRFERSGLPISARDDVAWSDVGDEPHLALIVT